jgi:glutathione peroxidase
MVSAMKALLIMTTISCLPLLSLPAAEATNSIYDIPLKDIDGKDASLKPYQGKVLLIVNVASKCGHTPQYAGLEALYEQRRDQGLVVLGFPCNQFGGQEPGSSADIKQFCSAKYNVSFPLFEKLEVNGPGRHPLYEKLAGKGSPVAGNVGWNFTKFLVGRDGRILKRFEPKMKPDAPELTAAVEAALAAK